MVRTISTILGGALLGALSLPLLANEAAAADACIPPAVTAALADCSAVASAKAMSTTDLLAEATKRKSSKLLGILPGKKSGARASRADGFAPRDFDAADQSVEASFQRFLCGDKPAASDVKAREARAEIAYARARLHFEAQHFAEAAVLFRDVALHHADAEVGIYASQLYLESLNVLGSLREAPAPSCFDDMARDVPIFLGLYCKDGNETTSAEQCRTMNRIQRDLLRLDAERLVKEGDRGGPDGLDGSVSYQAAAATYLGIWERYGRAVCEAKDRPSCERMDEILDNAARAYQSARRTDKAIATRKILLDPRYHLDRTDLARKAVLAIGAAYQSLADYDEAAGWYERFALETPREERAREALSDALVLRLGLGQLAQADADARAFSKNYGAKSPAQAAKIAFAIATYALDQGDSAGAKRRFEAAMPAIDKGGSIAIQIQAHAGLGRALAALDKHAPAAIEYGKVRALYRDPARLAAKIAEQNGGSGDRALAQALTAVGEAIFFFAEEKRRAAEEITLRPYSGPHRRDGVVAYVNTAMATWIFQRRTATDAAEEAYAEGLALQPMPAPKWVVASAERVAGMYGALAREIYEAPLPVGWKVRRREPGGPTWEVIRGEFRPALAQVSEPFLARAKSAYRVCLERSVKYQSFGEPALACAAWLSSHSRAEFPPTDEFTDSPTHRSFDERRPQLPRAVRIEP